MKLKVLYLSFLFLVSLGLSAQDIAEIDANFRVAKVGNRSVHYFDALSAPFEVTGFPWWKPGEELHRLPSEFSTKEVSDFMLVMAKCTSGGAIRFQTDSPYLAVKASYGRFSDMSHIPRSGTAGFDLFVDDPKDGSTLCGTVFPGPKAGEEGVEICLDGLREGELLTYTLYLPLYSSLTSLEIGFKPGSRLLPPPPQKMAKAICFYGSSITQGACASRPANNYTTMPRRSTWASPASRRASLPSRVPSGNWNSRRLSMTTTTTRRLLSIWRRLTSHSSRSSAQRSRNCPSSSFPAVRDPTRSDGTSSGAPMRTPLPPETGRSGSSTARNSSANPDRTSAAWTPITPMTWASI